MFAGKNGWRQCCPPIAKKMSKLQPSLAFLPDFENKRFKAFLLECGISPLPPPFCWAHPLGIAAWLGHSSEVCELLALPISIHYLSSPLSPIGVPPTNFKQSSIGWRKQILFLCFPLTQEAVVGWPHVLHHFQKVLDPLLLPQKEQIGLTVQWPSSFPAFSHSPWRQNHPQQTRGRWAARKTSEAGTASRAAAPPASSGTWFKGWTPVNLRQSLSDMRVQTLLRLLLTPSLTSRKCTRRKPQAERILGVSFVLWPAATLLQHGSNNRKPAIKAKFKQLKQIMNTGPGLTQSPTGWKFTQLLFEERQSYYPPLPLTFFMPF